MADAAANPPMHGDASWMRRIGRPPVGGALSRRVKNQPHRMGFQWMFEYARPYTNMWRGHTPLYRYKRSLGMARYGEGDAVGKYHQYFSHAKDPLDVTKPGRDFELMLVSRGKMHMKPLPKVQFVPADAKPKWHFKSWLDPYESMDPWQREVQYENHIPTHLDVKRPLSVLAPSTLHRHVQLLNMENITFTVSPFLFGLGHTVQKAVLDFYRLCISGRSMMPKDRVILRYAIDAVSPQISVKWIDGSTYSPPLRDRITSLDILQMVMEQAWLAGDRAAAAGKNLVPVSIDEYKWHQVVTYIKKKEKKDTGGKGDKK